jgi:glycosyltransferase involved in cell wall biosynthesis
MNKEKENSKFYLYVTGILDSPVLKSQVLGWIEVLQNQGIIFNILSCPSIPYLIKHRKRQKLIVKKFRDKLKGKIYQLNTFRSLDKFDFISPIIKAIYILFIIYREGRKKNFTHVILQTRSGINFKTFKLLKKINKKIKVVFEFRGAAPEEYLNSFSIDNIEYVKDYRIRKNYEQLIKRDADMFNLGDLIYCVSDSLKNYILNINGVAINSNKIYVVPGAADEKTFFYNQALRANKRKELCLESKRILIYTGRFKNIYHKQELIFEFAAKFTDIDQNNIFICLTPDISIANELKNRNKISDSKILIKFAKEHTEINSYLNAADIGIILRDNVPTNNVASPTKLAEYLLTGLPVIVSNHIGDYSDFIRNNDLGMVVNNKINDMINFINMYDFNSVNRLKNSEISKARFSKQANIQIIMAALNGL